MRLYLCGPISQNPGYREEFKFVAEILEEAGHTVCNPVDLADESEDWKVIMKKDLIQMLQCDAVAIVHTHHPSQGQALEMHIANQLGMKCQSFESYL